MKKIARRTSACLLLVLFVISAFSIYFVNYLSHGDMWVSFQVNRHVYSDAVLATGKVTDRNGLLLARMTRDNQYFCSSELTRKATLHTVGDINGNIGTGILSYHATDLMGYNVLNGVYSHTGVGNTIKLSIDSSLNEIAYTALAGRKGAVVFYNYKTGEILTMVSTPTYDPYKPLSKEQLEWSDYEGVYINRAISSTFTPGSVFKIVTLAAAIENIDNLFNLEFYCNGEIEIAGETITCSSVHGHCDIYSAFAGSCNVAFAEIAQMLGGKTIYEYMKKLGLIDSFEVSGIPIAKGSFEVAEEGSSDLSWSGIGQYEDMVNPMALTRLMGAIANKGVAVNPKIISGVTGEYGLPVKLKYHNKSMKRLLSTSTAEKLSEMLRYNVTEAYYSYYNFDSYEGLCAKSGTAEMDNGKPPHAWFTGFIGDKNNPYAFTVIVENSGWGLGQAAPIANDLLYQILK